MTLSKQLLLLISTIFLAIFAVNFVTSINNIRDYLQVESEVHAQDTATSLGLSLSPYILDENDTILETMVNSIFDRGYYLEIRLDNRYGKELLRKTNPKNSVEVPQWFTRLLPMQTATAESEIDAGWVKGGTVYVTIHPGFGYLKLWQQAQESLLFSALALVISVMLLFLLLRFVLRPLVRIDRLALSIAEGNFATIDPLPWTTEIRNVANSMNLMSGKIEKMIGNLNGRLQEASLRLRTDELTGLENADAFETEMEQRLGTVGKGYVLLMRIDALGRFASAHDAQTVDELIKAFVAEVRTGLADASVGCYGFYRIVGAKFMLVLDGIERSAVEGACRCMVTRLEALGERYHKPSMVHIGAVAFGPPDTTSALVAAASEAYEKARLIGDNSYAFAASGGSSRSAEQWSALVHRVVGQHHIGVDYSAKAYSLTDTRQLLLEEAIAQVSDSDGQAVPIGTFVSVAENIGQIQAFDRQVIEQVLIRLRRDRLDHDLAVNLSFSSLASNEFRAELFPLLQRYQDVAARLVFSVTAYAAARDLRAFATFIDFAHRCGCKVLLKRFESRFMPLEGLKQYKIDYIRLARVYTEQISRDGEKRRLVEALNGLCELLNIALLAEAVVADEDYVTVRDIGLRAASR